jgi:XTP/dITP diphosphohydrolase
MSEQPQRLKLLVATHNPGKVREYRALLTDMPLEVTYLDEQGITTDVEETGDTFEANAVLKATTYAAMSGLLTWADDSGLEVDALNGAPGVYSARFGGPGLDDVGRYQLLLQKLRDIPPQQWTARFRCVVAIASPNGGVWTVSGSVEGRIVDSPRGSNGFGYDPVFYMEPYGGTMAELPPDVKNRVSHRAKAAAAAKELLRHRLDALAGA